MKKIFIGITAFFLPLVTRAQDLGGKLLDETATGSKGAGYQKATIEVIVGNTISIVLQLLGVIFLVLIVYGGYTWMMAGGDEGKVEKAKDTMTRAIIGLAIVLASYGITYFVINRLTEGSLKVN